MEIKTALTYDDVLLVPQKSEIRSRQDVDTTTKLSRNIELKIPLISANMDTVTESHMAIAMAQAGGIGIIHRFCNITYQAREVAQVKRKQNVIIDHPFTIHPEKTLAEVKEKIKELHCRSFLVSEDDVKLLGILTNRDMMFTDDKQLVKDVMTPKNKLTTAQANITPEEAREILRHNKIEKLPLIDTEGNIKGLITATDITKKFNNTHASKDAKGRLLVGAAIGAGADLIERSRALINAGVDVLIIDIAHGHSINELTAITKIKAEFPDIELIGGNVATAQGARDLIKAGVDAIKVGIGPGSTCTTRTTTGFGVPQLTAIMNIAPVCQEHNIPFIADGGVKTPADFVKALAAGADTVMMGGQFSGCEETPGPILTYRGRQYKISRGMASLTANLARPDAKENINQVTPEGVESRVPYRGPAQNVINQFMGGLRSGMSYGNAKNLAELKTNAQFIRITPAGMVESHSHDNEML